MNCAMPKLKRAFEAAGFTDVKTLLSSGNVVFSTGSTSLPAIEKKAEAAMEKHLGQRFLTIVRSVDALRELLASDPYKEFRVAPDAKRIVTFLRAAPKAKLELPIERDNARILALHGTELFSAYLPTPKGPVFMTLIEKALGKEQTTRTWQTVEKLAL
jgi:uncharacterized protein (DUF1697 family)